MIMFNEIILAIIQAATEFLPISSSGHLALASKFLDLETNLFLFTILHIASLLAVLVFTRKEIYKLITFQKNYRKMWTFLIIGTIPAAFVGYFFNDLIESTFSSLSFIGIAFIFTSFVVFSTKFSSKEKHLNLPKSLVVGLAQILALFPGVSRSGMTISTSRILNINKEESFKFSFLLFIPLAIGANILEFGNAYFSLSLLASFFLCLILSLLFLSLLYKIIEKDKFWIFSIYCFILGIVVFLLEII